jgi:hypothetical protein
MSELQYGYIVRITHDQTEWQLFHHREFFVSIKRDWSSGSKVIFVKRLETNTNGNHYDKFIGSGIIENFVGQNNLAESELQKCAMNNWYGKLVFRQLVRFVPPLPTNLAGTQEPTEKKELSSAASQGRTLLQTGMSMKRTEIDGIERTANIRIFL